MAATKRAKRNGKNGTKPSTSVMDVESWPIDRVIPYARNPRKNAHAVAKVAASLKEFGWRQPIVVDKERVIIVGHTRLLAALDLEMKVVPVHVATNLTPAQVKAYRLADNRIGQDAEWDTDLLALEFNDLELAEFDMESIGFAAHEIAQIMGRGDVLNPAEAWAGMPEYEDDESRRPFRELHIYFASQADVDTFATLIGQTLTESTSGIWFPAKEKQRLRDTVYAIEPGA